MFTRCTRCTVAGLSIGEIARRLNAQGLSTRKQSSRWERSVIWAMLRNPAYRGTASFGKTRVAGRVRVTRALRRRGGLAGRWRPQYAPKMKKRTALLQKLREIFRRHRQPVQWVVEQINPILRGWVTYFAIGYSSRCFQFVKRWDFHRNRLWPFASRYMNCCSSIEC